MSGPVVEVYAMLLCPYCIRARRLLRAKGAPYHEIRIDRDAVRRQEMEQRSGRRTVPQIFIGQRSIGGYDEMAALDRRGELDMLLSPGQS